MRKLIALCVVLFALAGFSQDRAKLERTVNGHVLKSEADPAALLTFDRSFAYAGGQVIDIFHVAGAEQYFFVEAGPDRSVKRFYWIQFEHYYPDNTHTYRYNGIKGQHPLKIGLLDFLGDVRITPDYFASDTRPGSDSVAARTFLTDKGYKMPGTFVTLRMFHNPDAEHRKELMIIYGEALAPGASEDAVKAEVERHAQELLKID